MTLNNDQYLRKIQGENTYSQAGQDYFVCLMHQRKFGGTYVEIGGSHPFESNNTYLLEKEFNWEGISFEIDQSAVNTYNESRRNQCILADALKVNYLEIFNQKFNQKQIDYLSIDIEPAANTYEALLLLPHELFRFSVITFEHDRYASGDEYMNLSRDFLIQLGYKLVVSNVKTKGRDFEDWWVDPLVIGLEIYQDYFGSDLEFQEIFK